MKFYSTEKLDIHGHSFVLKGKDQSGDAFDFWQSADNERIYLIVADGVGTYACDWKASATACKKVKEFICDKNVISEETIIFTLNHAHESLKKESGKCSGMMSTCSFVLWELDENRIYHSNIGDSRIYKVKSGKIELLTRDDSSIVPVRENGKLKISQGSPVFAKAITRALGQKEPLDFIIQKEDFNEGEILILASDGAHGDGQFETDLYNIVIAANLKTNLNSYLEQCSNSKTDDATLLVLRRKDFSKSDLELCSKTILNNLNYQHQHILEFKMVNYILNKINEYLKLERYHDIKMLIDYLEKYSIYPGREELISLVDKMGKIDDFDKNLFDRILSIIRTKT